MKNLYEILNVREDASPAVIRAAYKALCMMYHPDRYHEADATDKMQEINSAYEILSDENKRKIYDLDWAEFQRELKEDASEKTEAVVDTKNEVEFPHEPSINNVSSTETPNEEVSEKEDSQIPSCWSLQLHIFVLVVYVIGTYFFTTGDTWSDPYGTRKNQERKVNEVSKPVTVHQVPTEQISPEPDVVKTPQQPLPRNKPKEKLLREQIF